MRKAVLFLTWTFLLLLSAATAAAEGSWVGVTGRSATALDPTVTVLRSDASSTVLTITLTGFSSEKIAVDGQSFQKLSLPGYLTTFDVGNPEVPAIRKLIAIPAQAGVSVEVTNVATTILRGYRVYPSQTMLLEGEAPKGFDIDAAAYGSNRWYPAQTAEVGDPQIWRDLRVVNLSVYPIQFNPATGDLKVITRMTVRLNYKGVNAVNALSAMPSTVSPEYSRMYRHEVANYDKLGILEDLGDEIGEDPNDPPEPPVYYDYLVIAVDRYVDNMLPFRHWKNSKGIQTTVIPLSTIGTAPDAEAIRDFIYSFYQVHQNRFVLLVGDPKDLPGSTDRTYFYGTIFSDFYYSLLTGSDNLPDLAVGRISPGTHMVDALLPPARIARAEADIDNAVLKMITYEANPPSGEWLSNALLVAHQAPLYQECKEGIRDESYSILDPSFTTVFGAEGGTNAAVSAAINSGHRVVNYRGHGRGIRWYDWAPGGTDYTLTDARALANGDMTPVVFAAACSTSAVTLRSGDCLAEAFTLANDGAAAYLGASQASWTAVNSYYDSLIFKIIFDIGFNAIGQVSNIAAVNMINHFTGSAPVDNAWMYLWLGDPSMEVIYTPPPATTIWVDGVNGSDPEGDGTFESPYQTILKAISVAGTLDTIQVEPGTYTENLVFIGKRIIVNGHDGPEVTILQPRFPDEPYIKMIQGEGAGAQFSGFTVTGGGDTDAFLIEYGAIPVITNNIFDDAVNAGYTVIKCSGANPLIARNIFVDNVGDGCVGIASGTARIINNTFANNAYGVYTLSGQGIAKNNIVLNSTEIGVSGTWTDLTYNDVYPAEALGSGNIYVDPMLNADYTLMSGSPCINAGDPGAWYNDPDGSRNDIGRYPYVAPAPPNQPIVALSKDGPSPLRFDLGKNHPNPFNPTTIIAFTVPTAGKASLDVFNILGQHIRCLLDGEIEAGAHSVVWDGRDGDGRSVASGIYFYRLRAGTEVDSKKMILMK